MIAKADKCDWWPEPPELPAHETVELVPMRLDQVDEILVLENASFPTPWSRDSFEYDLTKNSLANYWVVLRDGEIIGYAGIWLVGNIAHLTTICLTREFQGRGLGRWFLLTVMQLAKNLGARRFTLEVMARNDIALNLYKSVGYREVGRRENYYQEISEDAIVMWTGDPPYEG